MSDAGNTPAHEAARLEAALDRIEAASGRPSPEAPHGRGRAELASRLDALIAELRQVLGRDSAD